MVNTLSRNWGWIALRGIVALLFGALTLFYPGLTVTILVLWFGAYALVDGIFMVIAAIAHRHGEPRWIALLLGGAFGIAVGVTTFYVPEFTIFALLAIVAAWAIVTGIMEIVAAIRLRKEIVGEWTFVVAGLLAVAFGVTLLARPGAGALALAVLIALYAIVSGALLVALGLRLRRWGRMHPEGGAPHPA
jgi:uncharacterized membrane protein HdeD (DUF308 family)